MRENRFKIFIHVYAFQKLIIFLEGNVPAIKIYQDHVTYEKGSFDSQTITVTCRCLEHVLKVI